MATLSNVTLAIARNVANAIVTVDYDITWSAFDQATNLSYIDTVAVRGDDTGQDGDNGPVGDDPISLGLVPIPLFGISYDGQPTTHRSKSFTIAWTNLNEDPDDDEIRAVVTLTPQLPVATSRESGPLAVVVTSP